MGDDISKANWLIEEIRKKKPKSTVPDIHEKPKYEIDVRPQVNYNELGMIDTWKLNQLKRVADREAMKIAFNTGLTKLKYQAEAHERESKAFWDAKSVEIAESIKTYLHKSIGELEVERLKNKSDSVMKATEVANTSILKIMSNSALIDTLRDISINKILDLLDSTIDDIEKNSIATKQGLN